MPGGGLEPHRERELEDDHGEERESEQRRHQRETPLIARGARHGVTVRIGMTTGGPEPRAVVSVTSTAAGRPCSSAPLQRSFHDASVALRERKRSAVTVGSLSAGFV